MFRTVTVAMQSSEPAPATDDSREASSLVEQMDSTLADLETWRKKRDASSMPLLEPVRMAAETASEANAAVNPSAPATSTATSSRVQHFESLPRNELITEAALHNAKLDELHKRSQQPSDDEVLKMHAAAIAKQRMLELGLFDEDGEDDLLGGGAAHEGKEE